MSDSKGEKKEDPARKPKKARKVGPTLIGAPATFEQSSAEVLATCKVDAKVGLTDAEVTERQKTYGRNEIPPPEGACSLFFPVARSPLNGQKLTFCSLSDSCCDVICVAPGHDSC
jgi:hypothetical protein